MAIAGEPSVILSSLQRADGSATFSQNGHTIIGAVNGPIEVLRRDELPEEAALEVAVRPFSGASAIRERHLETVVQAALRQIVRIQDFPRTLIQITLQIIRAPDDDSRVSIGHTDSLLPVLNVLLQAAVLALLSASLPMTQTLTSVLLAVHGSKASTEAYITHPDPRQIRTARSLHMLAFSNKGELLVNESEGSFSLRQWEEAYDRARLACSDESAEDDRRNAVEDGTQTQFAFLRSAMQEKVESDLAWKPDNR